MLRRLVIIAGLALAIGLAHAVVGRVGEPFFNNDETRHVMTGVFFRDVFHDLPLAHPIAYTTEYYLRSPALGLLVWPPLFYAIEGLAMLVLGTSMVVAKGLIGVFLVMALSYLFALVERTHGTPSAVGAALIFGFAPLVFEFSRQVMLEIPCLAFALASIHHALVYLDVGHRRDLWLSAAAASAAALTRFDAVYLLPLFTCILLANGRFDVLKRREVIFAAMIAVMVVLPAYAISAREFGSTIRQSVSTGTTTGDPGFLALGNLVYYPARLHRQLGAMTVGLAAFGIVTGLASKRRDASWPYLAMIAATYLTFTPLAEVESRHVIYWTPAFALFAASGASWIAKRARKPLLFALLVGVAVAASAWSDGRRPAPYLMGYAAAARYVVDHTEGTPVCLFDGALNGNFIYQARQCDPGRRLWILRGDKILYATLINPEVAYVEYAGNDQEIVATLQRFDPALIVVEEPALPTLPVAKHLRETLKAHPERFQLAATFPVDQNLGPGWPTALLVYRSLVRNDKPERLLDVPMLGLGRSLQATIPGQKSSENRPNP